MHCVARVLTCLIRTPQLLNSITTLQLSTEQKWISFLTKAPSNKILTSPTCYHCCSDELCYATGHSSLIWKILPSIFINKLVAILQCGSEFQTQHMEDKSFYYNTTVPILTVLLHFSKGPRYVNLIIPTMNATSQQLNHPLFVKNTKK